MVITKKYVKLYNVTFHTETMTIQDAIDDLRRGRFVMIHDDGGRENEYDLMVAAQFMTPKHVSKMRKRRRRVTVFGARTQFCHIVGAGIHAQNT